MAETPYRTAPPVTLLHAKRQIIGTQKKFPCYASGLVPLKQSAVALSARNGVYCTTFSAGMQALVERKSENNSGEFRLHLLPLQTGRRGANIEKARGAPPKNGMSSAGGVIAASTERIFDIPGVVRSTA